MNVHGVGAGIRPTNHGGRAANANPSSAQAPVITSASSETGQAKGVVRLLQEGHFKGVADVRLRINFHDEITQISSEAVNAGFNEALEAFFAGVDEDFANLLTDVGATEGQVASATELFDGFKSSINDIANAFLSGGGTDFGAVAAQFQTEFDTFIIELQAQLELEVDNSFLDEFSVAFADQLSQLVNSIAESASVLPAISEPNGNGVAYAKFMEILEGLNASEADAESEGSLPEVLV